ncbi:polysaccharide biosynthesis protein [Staphylococcus sp. Marseille-Q5304]|uniref:putative polysaccharide biosynthesis protein n=1 Tax=Staphylococcus sp. Marseille-Q5304 TaxID=2942200 RepID=UPI0020731FC8|nr:polysaccharide biosynthesis protein [Staphylococcus sp. Marseille-Q5304]
MSESKELVRGTFLITLSIMITKILGIIYFIPFSSMFGDSRNLAPFSYAYTPYNIAIAVATAGIPLAASKYVAKYNALGAYRASQKFYRSSFIVMAITGFIGFLILYFLAPGIADLTLGHGNGKGNGDGWSVGEVAWVIKIISVVVIFIPLLATWRGVFQGYKSMGPTAVSEVIEQIARIIFILVGCYLMLHVLDSSLLIANGIATFGAAIGAIAALFTLWYYWQKRKHNIDRMIEEDTTDINISYTKMYLEIISYSIPFVIVSLNFPLFNLVDQMTHNPTLKLVHVDPGERDHFFTILNMFTNKIVMIPASLASGFAVSLIPFITKTFAEGNTREMHRQIRTSLGVLMYITVPASLGIMALALPIYVAFYGRADGSEILFYYAPVGILIALLSVTASMLQGIDKQKLTVFVILAAVVIKFILNIPLIMMFHTVGAVFSTGLATLFAVICNLVILKIYAKFNFSETWLHFGKIFIYSFIMMIVVEICSYVLQMFIEPHGRFSAGLIVTISVIIGMLLYAIMTMKTRLADEFLGDLPNKIRRKLGILK